MLAVSGLNHVTIAVSELERSYDFYVDFLGLKPHALWSRGAYLSAGSLWLCLSLDEAKPAMDYTHIAFTIEATDLGEWNSKIDIAGIMRWKKNTSEGDSIYLLDPDGHQLELHVGDLKSRLDAIRRVPYENLEIFKKSE